MNRRVAYVAFFVAVLATSCSGAPRDRPTLRTLPLQGESYSAADTETAVLAGGCFWGMEAIYEQIEGVVDVVSGYSGGDASTASYRQVGSGTTGHAESVRIVFDPKKVDYATLLEVFFAVAHDPTQLNYQGPDWGTQYRSAIFYANPTQKKTAEDTIARLERKKAFPKPIVTEVSPLTAFYPAEGYHQDFMRLNPDYPYIVQQDWPRVMRLYERFSKLVAR